MQRILLSRSTSSYAFKRISKLSDHLQGNIHDFASRQGLQMIGKRKRLLSTLKKFTKYQDLLNKIGIRG